MSKKILPYQMFDLKEPCHAHDKDLNKDVLKDYIEENI